MDIIIILHIGIAVWLYRYFARQDRGSKEPQGALRSAILFGVGALLVAGFINDTFLPKEVLDSIGGTDTVIAENTLIRSAFQVGFTEEILKFVPLAIFIGKKKYFNELTDGVIYFGLAGMWFGAFESISYAVLYGSEAGVSRAIVMPFLHAALSAVAGVGLARYKLITKNYMTIIGWLGLAIGLHGIYDYFAFKRTAASTAIALIMAFSINFVLFVFFKRARSWDEGRGLSAVGINKFCRSCGAPNPQGMLFCTSCGKRT